MRRNRGDGALRLCVAVLPLLFFFVEALLFVADGVADWVED
jgi:hypothetical protein